MDIVSKYFPHLTQKQIQQYAALQNLYAEWNKKINVISRKDMEHFYEHHVLHSLAIAKIFSFPGDCQVMDLGSGGGFPGIPLAIFFPGTQFYLVDSIKKKISVVNEIAQAVGLTNVSTGAIRAEDLRGRKFDLVVSRAVAPLKQLWRWSEPLIKNEKDKSNFFRGLACLKGGDLRQEIAESGCGPDLYHINDLFNEDFFKKKYLLFVKA